MSIKWRQKVLHFGYYHNQYQIKKQGLPSGELKYNKNRLGKEITTIIGFISDESQISKA